MCAGKGRSWAAKGAFALMGRMILIIAAIALCAVPVSVRGAAEIVNHEDQSPDDQIAGDAEATAGYRMVDRFSGFRFEVHGRVQGVWFRKRTQQRADELACFGWVQNTARGTVVGEARCAKQRGPRLKRWLAQGPTDTGARVDKVEFMDYRDTKIMYHFTHFRILPNDRLTCFEDAGPHRCAYYQPSLREGVYDKLDPLYAGGGEGGPWAPREDPLPPPDAAAQQQRQRDEL